MNQYKSDEELRRMYTPQELNLTYLTALSYLIAGCNDSGIGIKSVNTYMNGFQILFENISGDAIIHDGSYGRATGCIETIGMPWDYDDVSTHDPKHLVKLMKAYLNGERWEDIENGASDE